MRNSAAVASASLSEALENLTDLYIRVSTTEQAEEGYSVGEQEARGRAYCEAYGLTIHAVHIDAGYSGATLDRPGIKQVIKDVRSGKCKKVVVWKLDRLSRSQKDTLILLEDVLLQNGCGFVSIMESFDTSTPFGRCIVGILAAFAQMERENIKARMMMGRQASVKSGNYCSGVTPIGYRSEQKENGKHALVADPYSSLIVKDMYRLYNTGYSLGDIGAYLQGKYGIYKTLARNEAGAACSKIMRNPVYAGRVHMNGKVYAGKHEALVAPEEWQRANDRLAKNKRTITRLYSKGKGLLSGFLFCGCCGGRLAVRGWGWGKEMKQKYVCYSVARSSKRMIRDPNCTNRKKIYDVSELDALILDEIKKLSLDPDALDALIEEKREAPDEAPEGFAERLTEVEKQITRILNLYQTGVVELEEIQERLAALKDERAKLQENLDALAAESSGKMSKADALSALGSFSAVIDGGNPDELFALVHSLIEKVVILNEEITIHWAFC